MTLSKRETRDLYRQRAKRYDFSVIIYRLFGFGEARYRQDTVDSLALSPGNQVVEIVCGTGLDFAYLQFREYYFGAFYLSVGEKTHG